jgi:hypothetical protein
MSNGVPQPNDCCPTCNNPVVQQVPGPTGNNGINAFTTTTLGFTMPAISSQVVVNVQNSSSFQVGQVVFIPSAGYFQIFSKPNGAQLSLTNLGYSGNAISGTAIGTAIGVSPAGLIGPTGPAGSSVTLNQISPTTSKGDMLFDNGNNSPLASVARLSYSGDGNVLQGGSGEPFWGKIDISGASGSIVNVLPIVYGGTGRNSQAGAIIALLPSGIAAGDLFQINTAGNSLVRLPLGAALQRLRANAAANAVEYAYAGALQMVFAKSASYSSSAATYPGDDTVPLVSGGAQLLTQSFTPVSAGSTLVIEASVNFDISGNDTVTLALFSGSVCIGSSIVSATSAALARTSAKAFLVPGSTSAITLSLRMGSVGANTVYINGNASARRGGGTQIVSMQITELQ